MEAVDTTIFDNVNVLSVSLGGGATDYDDDNLAIGMIMVGAGTLNRDFPAYIRLGNGQNYFGVSLYNGHSFPNTPVPFI
ncbi:Subtilisin protease SBT1.7 [Spatholobus suberectus]|nr:Subtilisin protease SBT1.7 [Spatholobus suberectus]